MLAGSLVFTGCKKEGCTNEAATNYDADAKEDDGSCILPVVKPAADTEAPKVAITKPTASAKLNAGDAMDIMATVTDNVGATTWTYTVKDAAGASKATETASLGGTASESASASVTTGSDWAAGTYSVVITAGDAAGNTSAEATVSFEIETVQSKDTEKPTITAPVKKFPVTGFELRTRPSNSAGGKWDFKVDDNVELASVKVYLWNKTTDMAIDSLIETGIGDVTWSKGSYNLKHSSNEVGDKAILKIMATDAAGNEAEYTGTQEYTLSL